MDVACIICYEIKAYPFSCMKCGQVLCSGCVKKVTECPVCSAPKNSINPNMAVKKIIAGLTVPCKELCGMFVPLLDPTRLCKICTAP